MSTHPGYDKARAALDKVFGDTTVDRGATREALEELRSDIDGFLMNLNEQDAEDEDGLEP